MTYEIKYFYKSIKEDGIGDVMIIYIIATVVDSNMKLFGIIFITAVAIQVCITKYSNISTLKICPYFYRYQFFYFFSFLMPNKPRVVFATRFSIILKRNCRKIIYIRRMQQMCLTYWAKLLPNR